jgi:CheY-like chemotaxis protein
MSKVSVLIVDDASFIRDLVKKGLRVHFPGIRVEEAVNGRKAQQFLSRNPVDLILCDWEMPEMSGLDLLNWCRADAEHKSTPFIMVTSRGDKGNVVEAVQAGVSDYIGKPFTSEQLLGKVKKALHQAGRLEALVAPASNAQSAYAFGGESLTALTGGRAEAPKPSAAPAPAADTSAAAAPAAAAVTPATAFARPAVPAKPAPGKASNARGRGQLRLSGGTLPCLIKDLSLKDASLLIKSASCVPQVLESAVLDLQQGESGEIARLNGYVHAIAAAEPKPDSEWLQLVVRFVDSDPKKLEYLSRQIARGTTQKHFVPGG